MVNLVYRTTLRTELHPITSVFPHLSKTLPFNGYGRNGAKNMLNKPYETDSIWFSHYAKPFLLFVSLT